MKYKTIMIDPPWQNGMTGKRAARPNQGRELPYKTMTLDEINSFPVMDYADEQSLLFLWTTDKFIVPAHDILSGWGFKKHCVFVWDKGFGVCPFSVMFCAEFLIMGYRGKFKINKIGIKTVFRETPREHSRKPDLAYQIAEQLGDSPRIDIFSREKRHGWDQYGDQVDHFERGGHEDGGKEERAAKAGAGAERAAASILRLGRSRGESRRGEMSVLRETSSGQNEESADHHAPHSLSDVLA